MVMRSAAVVPIAEPSIRGIARSPSHPVDFSQFTPHHMQTFSPATDLRTRQLVWAYLKNGSPVCAKGEPGILTAVEIAGFYFKKYGEPLKPLEV